MDWLQCEVSAGQFSTEAAIRGRDYSGEEFSLFVPARCVRPETGLGDDWISGKVLVEVLQSRDGLSLVELPGQTFNNGRTITVRDDQIESAHRAQPVCGK